jgi:hypothetical protein
MDEKFICFAKNNAPKKLDKTRNIFKIKFDKNGKNIARVLSKSTSVEVRNLTNLTI